MSEPKEIKIGQRVKVKIGDTEFTGTVIDKSYCRNSDGMVKVSHESNPAGEWVGVNAKAAKVIPI